MAYSIRLPDGTTVANIPDTVSFEDAKAQILQRNPELAPKERSYTEAATDIGAGMVSGLGSLVQLPGQLYGLATGNMNKTGALGLGEDIQKYGEEMKSPGLKAREAARSRKVDTAEKNGQVDAFLTSFSETIKDPALLSSFLAEQVPQLLVPGGAAAIAGRTALKRGAAAGVEALAAKEAAVKAGTSAAVGVGAVQQGADVGAQSYEDIYKKLIEQKRDPAEAAGIAINLARAAGISGAAISLLAQRLPGAKALEEALAGKKGVSGILVGAGKGALGESVSEGVEEGGGKFTQNLAMREIDPTQSLMQGVGATAGQAAVGGVGMGGGAGAISGMRGTAPPVPVQQDVAQQGPNALELQAQQRDMARRQEQMGVQQGRDAREGEKILDAEAKAKADQEQAAQALADQATAKEMQEMRARRQAELEQLFPRDYNDVMQKTDAYGELYRERQALGGQTQTQEVKSRTKIVDGLLAQIAEEDTRVPMEYVRMQYANSKEIEKLPADMRAKNSAAAFTSTAPQQVEMREAINEQPLVPQTDLQGNPVQQIAPEQPASGNFKTVQTVEEAQAALDAQRKREARGAKTERDAAREAGQLGLFTRVGTPTAEAAVVEEAPPVPEPIVRKKLTPETIAPVITGESLGVLGIGPTAVLRRSGHAIQGLDITKPEDAAEVKNMLTIYKEGRSPGVVAKLDTFLARPEFQGIPDATPVAKNKPKSAPVARANKPSVGVPNKSAAADMGATGTGVPATTATSATPDGRGLVPAGQPAGKRVVAKRAKPAPIKAKVEPKKVEPKKVEPKQEAPVERTANVVHEEVRALIEQQQKLLTKSGRKPAINSPALAKWNALDEQIDKKKEESNTLDRAERNVEPKKVEPKKVEPKKAENTALVKARDTVDDLNLDPETSKAKVKAFAKRLHAAGLIDDNDLNAINNLSKDKDMGAEDVLDEVESALDYYEANLGKKPADALTDESNIIDVEVRVIPENQQLMLEGPLKRLQEDQTQELEEFYGEKRNTPAFLSKLHADVIKSINQGSKAVAKAIRDIVNQIAAGVLSVGMVFNPAGLNNKYNIDLPRVFKETVSTTAPVPEAAKAKMSPLAQSVYSAMAPVATKTGKWFMVADKPNGMLHIFKADGSHALSDPTLYGKDTGDVLGTTSSLEGGAKVTPAGKFTLKERDSKYAGGKELILVESQDETGFIAIHAADTSTPSERRLDRLETDTAGDNRISYGCINTKHSTFIKDIAPNIASLDGGLIFVLPDATEKTAGMFAPETTEVERTVPAKSATTDISRTVAKKEEKVEVTKATRSRITEDQAPVGKPISHAALEGIVADVQKSLGGNVDITILDSAKDLNSKAPAGAAGLVEDGRVYLFRDGIQSGIEGAKTVFHELFHLGLQKLLTNPKEYFRVMNNLYRMNTRVQGLADKWIASEEGQAAKEAYAKQYTDPQERSAALSAHAADEALARIAEELKTGNKIGTGQRAFVRSIAKWLANVAEAIGLRQVAQSIRSATYTQVEMFVQEAMSAAVGAGPVRLSVTRRFSAPSVPGGIDENTLRAVQDIQSKTPDKYKEPEKQSLINGLKGVADAEKQARAVLAVRQKTADKFATVSAKLAQMFSKGYRNAFGDLNPELLSRQAEDARKLVLDFYSAGGIKFNKDGLIETFDTKNSLKSAIEKVVDLASASKMTYKETEAYVSSLLEGHRLYSMREEHDKPLEASALILEQQGNYKAADAERGRKLARHMDNADVDTLEAAFQKSPQVKAILDTLNATRTQAIDLMIASGRITPEEGKFWNDNAAYVPFDRVFVEMETPNKGRGSSGVSSLRDIPGMKGSFERPIKNVFDSYTTRLGWMITQSANNNASYKVLDTMALGDFAKELTPGEVPTNKGLTIQVFRAGKPVTFEVDSVADFEAFQSAPELTGWLVSSLLPAARWVRVGVTAMPQFSIKQVIEDAQRAMFNSGVKRPLVVGMKTLYNFPRIMVNDALEGLGVSKRMPLVRQMEQLGIVGDYDTNIINPAQDIKILAGAEKRGVAAKVFHALEKITKASDLAARLAVYEETMRETGGDKTLAQLRARELINFSRRGSDPTIRTLSRVVPFMNAYAQGMDGLYRTATGLNSATGLDRSAARRQFYKKAAVMTSLGFLYAFAMSDDEGYKNASDEIRDNNFLIPNTDKKIPLPKELGFLFKSIPERLVEYYRSNGTPEEQSILSLLGSVVKGGMSAYGAPNATPSLIKPVLENMTNYSFFLQRELESASLQKLDKSQRSTSSTSELAKAIGELSRSMGEVAGSKTVEVSPIMVDNFLRGIFGLAGSTSLLITDALLNPTRPDRPLYQMPFASLFLYDTIGGRAKNEFYDLQQRVSQADATYKNMLTTDPEKAQQYFEKNAALIGAAKDINRQLRDLSKLRKERVMYEQGSDAMLGMNGAERREAIDEIRKLENESLSYIREFDKSLRYMQDEEDEA